MDKTKIIGGVLIVFALGIVGTGITSYSINAVLVRIYASPLLFDPAWSANFAIILGVFLLRIRNLTMTSPSEAAALLSISVMSAVITAATAARLLMTLLSNSTSEVGFSVPLGFQIGLTVLVTIIALVIAYKQGTTMISQPNSSSQGGINKLYLSIAMIINGGIVYGLGLAILQERWYDFSVMPLHFFGVILFVTGIIGIISQKKNMIEMEVWHRFFATFASGVGLANMAVLVQTVSFFAHDRNANWLRADFMVLTLSQAGFIVIGLVTSVTALEVSRYPVDDLSNVPSKNPTDVGILVSGLLAGGIGAFLIGILNFSTYGYIGLMVGAMAYTTSKIGFARQSTTSNALKYPYLAGSLFTGLETLFSIGLNIFNFIALPFSSSEILEVSIAYNYIFMGVSIASVVPITFMAVKAFRDTLKESHETLISTEPDDV